MAEQQTTSLIGETGILGGVSVAVASPAVGAKTQPDAELKAGEPKFGFWWGTGRRKQSVARVRIKPGDGKLMMNDRKLDDYFKRVQDRQVIENVLKALKAEKTFDVYANIDGGGTTGQAGAVVLGIARAMKLYDPSLIQILRDGEFLTRDSRMKERKKYGQRGARRRYQFSKR
jgi:small subunit ribosomal protein S9